MRLILVILFLFNAFVMFSTIDELYVNKLTKEYCYSDKGFVGVVGWENVKNDPSIYPKLENNLINEGYTKSDFTYKVDIGILFLFLIFSFAYFYIRKRKN